jgi:hypothetical protein
MSAAELAQRDKRQSDTQRVLEALGGRWLRTKQLCAELPDIPYARVRDIVKKQLKAGALWQREASGELEHFRGSSPVYEYRWRFM